MLGFLGLIVWSWIFWRCRRQPSHCTRPTVRSRENELHDYDCAIYYNTSNNVEPILSPRRQQFEWFFRQSRNRLFSLFRQMNEQQVAVEEFERSWSWRGRTRSRVYVRHWRHIYVFAAIAERRQFRKSERKGIRHADGWWVNKLNTKCSALYSLQGLWLSFWESGATTKQYSRTGLMTVK